MDRSDITGDRHCAAGMTGSTIQIGHHRFPDIRMQVCWRRFRVLVRVMAPMCTLSNCFVLTILTRCGRRDLQRYQHHQENKNPETHEGIVGAAARGPVICLVSPHGPRLSHAQCRAVPAWAGKH